MKIISLLLNIIFTCLFFTGTSYSQTKDKSDADYFLGTWSGMIGRGATDKLKMDYSIFMWRIHKVDVNKNQIEMTEIYHKASMYDTISTEKPRMIYPARIENKSLYIQLTDIKADTTFTLKLLPAIIDGKQNLQSEPGKLRFKNQVVNYMLGKFDSDTTNVLPKDQRKQITVTIQPPPPPPSQKKQ